jgi:hypothetical protein
MADAARFPCWGRSVHMLGGGRLFQAELSIRVALAFAPIAVREDDQEFWRSFFE